MAISIDTKGAFENPHFLVIKVLKKVGIEVVYLNTIKATYNIPTANTALNEKLKASLLKSRLR